MRAITVPADITTINRLTREKMEDVSFRNFALGRWANAPAAADNFVKLNRWLKVVDQLDACKPGELLLIEEEEFTSLKTVVEADFVKIAKEAGLVAGQLRPFYDVVLEAKTYEGEKLQPKKNGAPARA